MRFDVLLTVIARFGSTVLSAVAAVVVAQVLGSQGLGVLGLLRALPIMLVLFTEVGISTASSYLVNKRGHSVHAVYSNALFAGLVVGALDLVAWIAASGALNEHLFGSISTDALLLAALIAPLAVVQQQIDETMRALQFYRFANLSRVVLELGSLVVLLVAVAVGELTALTLVVSILAGRVAAIVIGIIRLARVDVYPLPRLNRSLLKESISFGFRTQIGNAINILNYRADHVILAALTDTTTVGVYVAATKAAEAFYVLPQSVRFVLEPKIAKQSRAIAANTVRQLFGKVFAINTVVIIVAFFVGPLLIPLFFDEWSVEAIPPFRLLLFGLFALGANGVISAYNLGQGQPQYNAYAVGFGLAATVAFDIVLIPPYGAAGAAIASSIAYSLSAATLVVLFIRERRRSARDQTVSESV